MLEYYSLFQDYLQLRAYIMDQNSSLDNPDELDVFINNTKHSQWLNRITHDERKIATMAHKYTAAQIVETLNTYLNEPDSPHMPTMSLTHHCLAISRAAIVHCSHNSYRCTPVNLIKLELSLIVSPSESDDSYQLLYSDLRDLNVPE